jgi:hypothetical protein
MRLLFTSVGTPIEKATTMQHILKTLILIIPFYTSIGSAETTSIMKLAPVEMESDVLSKLCFEHLTQDILSNRDTEILIEDGVLKYLSNGACLLMRYQPIEVQKPKVFSLDKTQAKNLLSEIKRCYAVDLAIPTYVKFQVGVKFTFEGKVKAGEIQLLKHNADSQGEAEVAFNAVRRAILRCQKSGYIQAKADHPDSVTEAILEIDQAKMRGR